MNIKPALYWSYLWSLYKMKQNKIIMNININITWIFCSWMFVDISFPPSLSGFPKDSLYFLSASFINLYLAFNFPSNDLYPPRSLLFSVSCHCPCQLCMCLSLSLSLFLPLPLSLSTVPVNSTLPVPVSCSCPSQLSLLTNPVPISVPISASVNYQLICKLSNVPVHINCPFSCQLSLFLTLPLSTFPDPAPVTCPSPCSCYF